MEVKSIKFNYALNIIRIFVTTLLGLITMPYINKTLGVDSIGKYEFINSIITYFILFSALGIPTYGIREIAKVRDDLKERSKVTTELFFILLITNALSYIILFCIFYFTPLLNSHKSLVLAICPIIFFTNLSFEWFYQAIENQLYITIRTVIVKIITLLALFLFIDSKDDYILYALILTISIVVSNLFNFIYLQKFISLKSFSLKEINIKRHLKGVFTIFLATISISIYLQIDSTLLGIYASESNVGLYATANKLVRLAILFVTTIGAVMLPRLSYLYKNNEIDLFYNYLNNSLKYILLISCPLVILIFGLSKEIILIMAGEEFIEAIIPMKILSILIFIIGLSYYFAFMILYPKGKEKIYTKIVFISALVSVSLNIILIPTYKEIATSIVTVIVEGVGLVLMFIYCRKDILKVNMFGKDNIVIILASIVMLLPIYLICQLNLSNWLKIIVSGFISLSLFGTILLLTKNSTIKPILKKI
jgi:O-antigen/teichoic acid export membrane protein